jgi:hypothetical protein
MPAAVPQHRRWQHQRSAREPRRVEHFARLGSELFDAGAVGHLNPASGFGEWPQAIELLRTFGVEVARAATALGHPMALIARHRAAELATAAERLAHVRVDRVRARVRAAPVRLHVAAGAERRLPAAQGRVAPSDTQLGSLSGIVSLMVGLLTVPLSLVADRWGRVASLKLMALLWCLATLACGSRAPTRRCSSRAS